MMKKNKEQEVINEVQENTYDVIYKSKLLNKEFNSLDELKEAEEIYNTEHAKEIAIKEERSKDLLVVQSAANAYLNLLDENNKIKAELAKKEQEAYSAYKKELDDFAAKHNGYHLTYKRDGNNVEFKIEENHQSEIEKYLEEKQKAFKSIWDNFWF